jgi:hypothetical protein
VYLGAFGDVGRGDTWLLGLDEWAMHVGVSWDGEEEALHGAVMTHADGRLHSEQVSSELAKHGVRLAVDETSAWIGQQDVVVAVIGNDLAQASSRPTIWTGRDLLTAADDAAGDLSELVAPLIDRAKGASALGSSMRLARFSCAICPEGRAAIAFPDTATRPRGGPVPLRRHS